MTWKHLKEPASVPCTKQLVDEFFTMEPAPHDRNLSPARVTFIKKAIIRDEFRVAGFASVYCRETKKTYRVNGKHTATVLNDLNGRYPKGLRAFVERYQVDTLADVGKLYSGFDHKRAQRTTSDINRVFAASNEDLADVSGRIVNTCASGMGFAKWEHDSFRREAEDRAGLLVEHPDFVAWVANLFPSEKKYRYLLRSAIVAAMFRTFQKSKKAATEFWLLVAEESHASNKHPTRVLARWLLTHGVYGGAHAPTHGLDSTRGMYVRCLLSWNAWRANRKEVELRFNPNNKTPEVA